jgi:hypothetical protein
LAAFPRQFGGASEPSLDLWRSIDSGKAKKLVPAVKSEQHRRAKYDRLATDATADLRHPETRRPQCSARAGAVSLGWRPLNKKRPSLLADAVLLFHLVSFIVSALGEPSFDISIYFETKLEASPRQPAALLV